MRSMKPNLELLRRLRTRFLRMRHADHFNMKPIAAKTPCGTAMCIAGHTLDLAGYKMRLRPDADEGMWGGKLDYDFINPRSGRKVKNALQAAAKELHMAPRFTATKNGAWNLFHDYSLESPRQAAERIQEIIEANEVRQ